jgi:hypothetical protein
MLRPQDLPNSIYSSQLTAAKKIKFNGNPCKNQMNIEFVLSSALSCNRDHHTDTRFTFCGEQPQSLFTDTVRPHQAGYKN